MLKKISMPTLTIFIVLISIVGITEVITRIVGKYYTHTESNGWGYTSRYAYRKPRNKPNSSYIMTTSEFKFTHSINNEGFRDIDHAIKKSKRKRLIILGDSFIVSSGTKDSASIPRLLEKELLQHGYDIEVISGGSSGGDPVTHYHNLINYLLKYSPDFVIMTTNVSDVTDIITHGGSERYAVGSPAPPRIELAWRYSHFVRFVMTEFFGYSESLISPQDWPAKNADAIQEIIDTYKKILRLAKENSFQFLLISFPYPVNILNREIKYKDNLGLTLKMNIDNVADAWPLLKKSVTNQVSLEKMYYPVDWHFTPRGYSIFSKVLAKIISSKLLTKHN